MVAAIVCAVSCGDPEGPAVVDPESISTVKTSYTIGAEGGQLEVSVLTTVDITVECAEPWVECVVTKAAENRTVKVTVQENTSTDRRSAKITVKGKEKSIEITLVQDGAVPVSPVEPDEPDTPDNPDTPSEPDVPDTPDDPDEPDVPDTPDTPDVPDNPDVPDEPDVPDTPDTPVEPVEEPVLTVGQATYEVPAEGQDIVVEITTNIDYSVTCDEAWITKVATKTSRVDRLTFTVAPNTVEKSRSAQIKFDYDGISVTVTVNQEAYIAPAEDPVLELSANEFQVAAEGEELDVKVTHNYDFEVNCSCDWVTYMVDGDDCFITVTENTGAEPRVTTLEIASNGLMKSLNITQEAAAVDSTDPFDCGSDLSKNETANCYVVTKAGDYSFKADVMGNGYYPEGWVMTYDQGVNLNLWPDDGNTVIPKASLKRAKAAVLWEDGDCLDGDPVYNSTDKRIEFKTNGNSGAAHIALKDQYDEILWSWLIWCTERPEDITFTTEDEVSVTMLDRNIGAVSANPEDDVLTYGYYYQWGRKDPLKLFNQINKSYYMQPNSETTVYYAVMNPEVVMKNTGKTMEWYNGKLATVVADLWGDPYNAGKLLVLPCDQETTVDDIYKTLYDPCPPGYMVAPAFVFNGLKDSDVEFVGTGAKLSFGGAEMFVPFAGYGDEGNVGGYDVGYYGYTDFYKLNANRGSDRTAIFWLGSTGRYRDGNFLAGTMIYLATNSPGHDEFREISIMNHIRARAQPVRCMREPERRK